MSFWSSEKIKGRQNSDHLVDPYSADHVKYGAYELSLGSEVLITGDEGDRVAMPLSPGQQVVIPPGQFGLLITDEVVSIPRDAIGFISVRTGFKSCGLVNVSGFHVDPGFSGRLKFSVYNAGPLNIVLSQGEQVFALWFSDLDRQTTEPYGGKRLGQRNITSQDASVMQGKVASPGALEKRLEDMDRRVSHLQFQADVLKTILLTLVVGVVIALVNFGLRFVSRPPEQSPTGAKVMQFKGEGHGEQFPGMVPRGDRAAEQPPPSPDPTAGAAPHP